MIFILATGGFALAQGIFWRMTGRAFWRAMVPLELRRVVQPSDPIKMDSFMYLEEWAALLFYGAYLVLPLVAIHVMGFLKIFDY